MNTTDPKKIAADRSSSMFDLLKFGSPLNSRSMRSFTPIIISLLLINRRGAYREISRIKVSHYFLVSLVFVFAA